MTAIANDLVVSFHYTLTNAEGETLDQSQGEPLAYLHGAGNIIPGLENALVGKKTGDTAQVRVIPSEGYGETDLELIQQIPREMFQGTDSIAPGMTFQAQNHDGYVQRVTVTAVNDTTVTVDANHPLAGQHLNFDVTIVDVRAATQEELDHGHVHRPGGHHH